jgi:hypothetical protein
VVQSVVPVPVQNKILEDESSSSSSRGDENINAIVDAIVNDIINNAVDLYFTKEEGLKGN